MVAKLSSVPLSEELRDLARFTADGLNGLSNFAVVSMPENDLLSACFDSKSIRRSIFIVILNNIEIIKHESPCQIYTTENWDEETSLLLQTGKIC